MHMPASSTRGGARPARAPAPAQQTRVAQASRAPATCSEMLIRLPARFELRGDRGTVRGTVTTNLEAGTYSIRYKASGFIVEPWPTTRKILHVTPDTGQGKLYNAYLASPARPVPLRVEATSLCAPS